MLHAAALFNPTPYVEDADVDEEALPKALRRDALPEHATYRDDGCSAHASCLTCPFVRCRYDVGMRKLRSATRDAEIRAMRRDGAQIAAITERFGVCRRTVFRVLALPPP